MALARTINALRANPSFALMRGVARFSPIRSVVRRARGMSQGSRFSHYCAAQEEGLSRSVFKGLDPIAFTEVLKRDGVSLGLSLPGSTVQNLKKFADSTLCYADRNPKLGFHVAQRQAAELVFGRPILLAQYYNTAQQSQLIAELQSDPFLSLVAAKYLGSIPTHVGTNVWWTFPVQASEEDRARHAHFYHADVDDFAFLKFFFYLTDVESGDGSHVCVPGTHRAPVVSRLSDYWTVRRYNDSEIDAAYGQGPSAPMEIIGGAGTGFAEDTLCVHKGMTPVRNARLLLQIQFALFDYGVQRDEITPDALQRIA
jgi:hypothetical protein